MTGESANRVTLFTLIETGVAKPGDEWFIKHRGERRSRTVGTLTKRGTIRIGTTEYENPSSAASAALGGTPSNGWRMWRFGLGTSEHIWALREQARSERSRQI